MCPTPGKRRQRTWYARPLESTHSSAARVIGIAGPSGSGKSTLAHGIAAAFADQNPVLLSLDAYYRGIDHPWYSNGEAPNFDTPAAIDWDLATAHVAALGRGEAIEAPRYDFATHLRLRETRPLGPADLVIVEGILALHHAPLRAVFAKSIYVEAAVNVCLTRRLDRDTAERGRSRESVLAQWRSSVQPMMERHVFPQESAAGFVADGLAPADRMIATTVAWLRT